MVDKQEVIDEGFGCPDRDDFAQWLSDQANMKEFRGRRVHIQCWGDGMLSATVLDPDRWTEIGQSLSFNIDVKEAL